LHERSVLVVIERRERPRTLYVARSHWEFQSMRERARARLISRATFYRPGKSIGRETECSGTGGVIARL
jgi:hypothetical protein